MQSRALKALLNAHEIKFVSILHSPAFTAQEVAASVHVPGHQVAKSVMVKIDGRLAMAVLPATTRVNLDQLRQITGADDVELAKEYEFAAIFPNCEVGAMPPFGNLFDLDVYVAEDLARDEMIAFNAGTHTEVIQMRYADYERLVRPKVVALT